MNGDERFYLGHEVTTWGQATKSEDDVGICVLLSQTPAVTITFCLTFWPTRAWNVDLMARHVMAFSGTGAFADLHCRGIQNQNYLTKPGSAFNADLSGTNPRWAGVPLSSPWLPSPYVMTSLPLQEACAGFACHQSLLPFAFLCGLRRGDGARE